MTARFRFGGARATGAGAPFAGPINGDQWVKDNAGPQSVSDPGGGISFTTRASLQTAIDANSAGSTFVHASGGTETWDAQINCGTKAPKIYFLGLAGSTSTIIDGGAANITGFSSTAGTGFEVHGGQFKRFGDPADVLIATHRAIRMNGPGLVEDVIATDCHVGLTLTADADNAVLRRCKVHANHRYGMTGSALSTNRLTGALVEHCIIDNNNVSQLTFDDASGTKFTWCTSLITRYNWVKNNYGWGIWLDGFHESCTIQENVTEDQWRGGIFLELSHGGNVIRRNACYRDCAANTEIETRHTRAAILISETDGTLGPGGGNLVTLNLIDTAAWPLILFDNDNRALVQKDCDVLANDMYLRSNGSRVGNDDAKATKTMHTDATIVYDQNRYNVLSLANEHWYHPTASIDSEQLSWAEWQAKGFDAAGSRVLI